MATDYQLRATSQADSHYLLDIDLKCFEYPWPYDKWREIEKTAVGAVVTFKGRPVGMVIFRKNEEGDVEVLKLGVVPAHRRMGHGRRLLWNAIVYAAEINAFRVVLMIPERRICPGQEGDLSNWLKKFAFRASCIMRDAYHFYGEPEDGVVFSCSRYGDTK